MNSRKLLALPLAFVGGVFLSMDMGCVESDPGHCLNNGGDEYCGEGKYCTNNCGGDYDAQGCLVADEPPAEGCWACNGSGDNSNCGSVGDGDSDSTDSETTAETDSTDATETMDTSTTETGPECMASSECPAEMPLCDDGGCVGCGDAAMVTCASEYPELPACDVVSGECKLCTADDAAECMGDTPVCEDFACVECSEHAQCPDSACNMAMGGCMDPERVWWVDQAAGGTGDGSESDPFDDLADALSMIGDGEEGTIYLSTANGHQEQFHVASGQTVALIGKSPTGFLQNAGSIAALIEGTAFVGNLRISTSNMGLQCATCNLWVDRVQVSQNSNGEMQILGGNVHVRNSFIGAAGLVNAAAMTVSSGTVEVLYSTVAGGGVSSAAIGCINGMNVSVRNSLVVALQAGDEVACPGAMIMNSALEADVPGNTALGSMPDTTWFEDYVTGDLGIAPPAPAEISMAAIWQVGDPRTDIDDEPRPASEGAADYAGADIPN